LKNMAARTLESRITLSGISILPDHLCSPDCVGSLLCRRAVQPVAGQLPGMGALHSTITIRTYTKSCKILADEEANSIRVGKSSEDRISS
jgi:hypothetical protein